MAAGATPTTQAAYSSPVGTLLSFSNYLWDVCRASSTRGKHATAHGHVTSSSTVHGMDRCGTHEFGLHRRCTSNWCHDEHDDDVCRWRVDKPSSKPLTTCDALAPTRRAACSSSVLLKRSVTFCSPTSSTHTLRWLDVCRNTWPSAAAWPSASWLVYLCTSASTTLLPLLTLLMRTNDAAVGLSQLHEKYLLPPVVPSCLPLLGSSHSTPTQVPSWPSTGPTYRTVALCLAMISRSPTSTDIMFSCYVDCPWACGTKLDTEHCSVQSAGMAGAAALIMRTCIACNACTPPNSSRYTYSRGIIPLARCMARVSVTAAAVLQPTQGLKVVLPSAEACIPSVRARNQATNQALQYTYL